MGTKVVLTHRAKVRQRIPWPQVEVVFPPRKPSAIWFGSSSCFQPGNGGAPKTEEFCILLFWGRLYSSTPSYQCGTGSAASLLRAALRSRGMTEKRCFSRLPRELGRTLWRFRTYTLRQEEPGVPLLALSIPTFLFCLVPPALSSCVSPAPPPKINVIIAMCACLHREWVSLPPPIRQVPRETRSHSVRTGTCWALLCRWAATPELLSPSVITFVMCTCARVCHSVKRQVRRRGNSQSGTRRRVRQRNHCAL